MRAIDFTYCDSCSLPAMCVVVGDLGSWTVQHTGLHYLRCSAEKATTWANREKLF